MVYRPKTLNPRQQLFVQEYLIDLNACRAARRAGYAPSTSDKKSPLWVGKSRDKSPYPEIWDAVQVALSERMERLRIDADWTLRELRKVYERCMQVEPVLDGGGNPTGTYKFNAAGALKALENIGKHVQVNAFRETDDHNAPIDQHWTLTIVDSKSDRVA